MDIMTLIRKQPILFADIKNLGLSHCTIHRLADGMTVQLGGHKDYDLDAVLHDMTSRDLMRLVDPRALAEQTKLNLALVQSVVLLVAPWVGRYDEQQDKKHA